MIGTTKVVMVWREGKSERTEKGHSGKCRGRNGRGENHRRTTLRQKMQSLEWLTRIWLPLQSISQQATISKTKLIRV